MRYYQDSLAGKTALITGAGRGIGKAIALAYAAEGAEIVCLSRTETELNETVRLIEESGGAAIGIPCDISDRSQVESAVAKAVERFGKIDILLLNAGVNIAPQVLGEEDPDLWVKTIEINLIGQYYCLRACVPHFKKAGFGNVISIGSGRGRRGASGGSAR